MSPHALAFVLERYLRAAPLPHAVALALTLSALLLAWKARLGGWRPLCPAVLACLGGAVLAAADGRSRYHDYLRAYAAFRRHGFRERLLRVMAGSRCQRDAARQAAADAGCGLAAADYYRARGYRWFHLLPDGCLDDPWRLVSVRFLRSSFLARRRAPARRDDQAGARPRPTGAEPRAFRFRRESVPDRARRGRDRPGVLGSFANRSSRRPEDARRRPRLPPRSGRLA